ncbi:hypothetical protein [Natrarchaeobaculum sulfurireducens]|uniref:Uncharacterized protein n=1 Tax=Natrarchaeobaculum sulfurireducens TaxID=2044521 RepID=A0A346PFP8_9EURY|nr:hypothetical protein [Natrarchaeobaculum sulfurireducens]AXR78343.1 hypothetical protein AArc1_2025 [Natrarchaeobaculum sulfurireducens]
MRDPVRSGACPDSGSVDESSRPSDEWGPPSGRVMTDGGQAQLEEADEETAKSDEKSTDDASESESAADDEAESAEETTGDDTETDGEAESMAEDATEATDTESVDEEAPDAEAESHVEDAAEVYQSDGTSGVAHLDLDGLFLDLLGLEVNLNEVTLDVSARPGENNLLGNLLSAVSGLLDGPSAVVDSVTSLLSKPAEFFSGLLERPRAFLSDLLSKPTAVLSSLFGFDAELTEDAEAGPEGDKADADAEEGPGRISRAFSWLKEKLAGLVPGFPLEVLVATIVREVIQAVIDQLEPGEEQESEQAEAAQAEA